MTFKNAKLQKQLTVAQWVTLCEALDGVCVDDAEIQETLSDMDYETAMDHLENYDGVWGA